VWYGTSWVDRLGGYDKYSKQGSRRRCRDTYLKPGDLEKKDLLKAYRPGKSHVEGKTTISKKRGRRG